MTSGLKTTLIFSSGIAVFLNLMQMVANTTHESKDALAASTASVVQMTPRPTPAIKLAVAATAATSDPAATPIALAPAPAAPDPVAAAAAPASSKLAAAGLNPGFAPLYLAAQAKSGTPWQLLAAVHQIETGQRGDSAIRSSAGAIGPMQFMPATFAAYKMDGDANGTAIITDVDDAVFTAANYLRAGGADKRLYNKALFNYNHSNTYVANVMAIARRLGL